MNKYQRDLIRSVSPTDCDNDSLPDLRCAIYRAISWARSRESKRRQRGLPEQVPFGETEFVDDNIDIALLCQELDVEVVLEGLSPELRQIWELLRDGMSTGQIGEVLNMDHRRVARWRRVIFDRLARVLDDPELE